MTFVVDSCMFLIYYIKGKKYRRVTFESLGEPLCSTLRKVKAENVALSAARWRQRSISLTEILGLTFLVAKSCL